MANTYYLIYASEAEMARSYAPTVGLPDQLFQCRISSDGTKAIVQAEWNSADWLDVNGVLLGELLPNGNVSQGVYDELEKPEWKDEEI